MALLGPLGAGAGGLGDPGPVGLGVPTRAVDGRRKVGAGLNQAGLWEPGICKDLRLALQCWSLTLCVLISSPTVMYTIGLATATISEYSSMAKRSSGSGTWQAL